MSIIYIIALLNSNKQHEPTNIELAPPMESTIYDHLVIKPSVTTAPIKRNEYESIYATPADIKIDDKFDNQIPSIHPINKQEFWNYVTNTPNEGFSKECKV